MKKIPILVALIVFAGIFVFLNKNNKETETTSEQEVVKNEVGPFRVETLDATGLRAIPQIKILSLNGEIVASDLLEEEKSAGILWDEINNGYIFITSNQQESAKDPWSDHIVKVYFFDIEERKLDNVYTTGPVEISGKGCESAKVESVLGEIILKPGCQTLGLPVAEDNKIYIKL